MSLQTSVKNDRRRVHVASGEAQGEFQFRRLLESLPAGAYTCDAEGQITYFNPQAVELWGRTPKLNHPDDRFCGSFKLFSADGSPIRHDQCWMALALRGRKEYNGHEILIERPDGNRVAVLAHANPFLDDSGKLLGAVNVLVDITARKRAEQSLRDAHDELAHKVVERTAELTELSRHLMEVAEEERAKLAAELHDEMGSLLTVLSMRLGRLGARLPATAPDLLAEHEQLIDLVRSMVASQRRIVENLRPLLLDSFGLGVALNRYVEDWSRNTGIPADVALAPLLPKLSAGAGLALFRIAQESLTNIAKYANGTWARIRVSSEPGHITLCVEDDGVGIAPGVASRSSSHGILGMRERLLEFGGQLLVEGGEGGKGTRVRAVMPV